MKKNIFFFNIFFNIQINNKFPLFSSILKENNYSWREVFQYTDDASGNKAQGIREFHISAPQELR